MAYVRSQATFVQETIRSYLSAQLATLGWLSSTPPFAAATPVTLIDYLPAVEAAVAPNTVAMTSGDEDDDLPAELGAASGGLFSTSRPYFIDVFGESQGIALRLADDIKAILTGKLSGTSRYQRVLDPVNGGTLTGHLLHFEDVQRSKPDNVDYKRNWQVIKLTAIHEFNASEYGGG